MTSLFHRSLEATEISAVLKQVFPDPQHFAHHEPLPAAAALGDEGAANHLRFAPAYGEPGINVFVYGREGAGDAAGGRFPARQTRLASESIYRLHQLAPERTLLVRQNPVAIDAGVFHNDVISTSNCDILFYHEAAFADTPRSICEINELYWNAHSKNLRLLDVTAAQVSLDQAVASYLFNCQIVNDSANRTILVVPQECQVIPSVGRFLSTLKHRADCPIDEIHTVHTTASMRNGGGPACLRLRVVMTPQERSAMKTSVILTDELDAALSEAIDDYPERVEASMFSEADFLERCFTLTERIYKTLGLSFLM